MGSFSKLKSILEEKDSFLLIGHEKPDGDCIGSMIALSEALKSRNKTVEMVCSDEIPEIFSFLGETKDFKGDFLVGEYEVVILVDNGDLRRTGFFERISNLPQKTVLINIDHHIKNDIWKLANINYADDRASSTATLIYEILVGIEIKISPKIATALLLGVYNDTGGFQHSNTSEKVLEVVSNLMSAGANLDLISKNIYHARSTSSLKLWGIALSRMVFDKNSGLIVSTITQDDIAEAEATEDEVSGLVNLMSAITEAKAALLLYECENGKLRGSLRTEKNGIDVSVLAKLFGGGGHKKAAGFTIEGKLIKNAKGKYQIA